MMRSWMITGVALAIAAPAWAQETSVQDSDATIVVTGSPLSETAKRLAACLERHCPPKEDIDASLAHAENQFLVGDYRGARATLAASHGRNARYAKEFPVDVADLDRAYGRLTNMDGRPELGRYLQISALETLKGGFESGDSRILAQRLMTGDDYLHTGRLVAAVEVYRKVEKQARKAGDMRIAGAAMLRPAAVYAALGKRDPVYRDAARTELGRIDKTTEPGLAGTRVAALVLRARLAGVERNQDEMDRVIAKLADHRFSYPVLVYDEPPFGEITPPTGVINRGLDTNPEWIDLSFRIDADGRVKDVDELRRSPTISNDWTKYVTRSIAKRRYVPLALPAGSPGMLRVERFTLVFDAESNTGSHMQARATQGRLVSLDLTPEAEPPARSGGG